LFCPRAIYSYWREIWLERVGPKPSVREQETIETAAAQGEHALSSASNGRSRE